MNKLLLGALALVVVIAAVYLAVRGPMLAGTSTPGVTNSDGTVQPSPSTDTSANTETPIFDTTSTAGKPSATTNASVAPTDTTAVVTGTINPEGTIATYWYEYGATANLGKKTSVQIAGSGFNAVAAPGYITGLTKNTTYFFKLVAANRFGTVSGEVNSFTTSANSSTPVGGLPTAKTVAANNITSTTATMKGTVNPNKAATKYWFEIGKDGTLGGVTSFIAVGDGSADVAAEASAGVLEPATTYYYRLNAQNEFGTVNGAILTFKTSGKLIQPSPVVTTQVVGSIGTTTATLTGTVNPVGLATSYWFEYGTDSNFAVSTKTTAKKSAGAVSTTVTAETNLTGLKANTTYYVRIVAQNAGATLKGDAQSFKTK